MVEMANEEIVTSSSATSSTTKVEDSWPQHLPPQRGGQKKAALAKQSALCRRLAGHDFGGPETHPGPGQKLHHMHLPNRRGSRSCGGLTHPQVGEQHQSLMSSLFRTASEERLDRSEIKELKIAVLQKLTRCHDTSLASPRKCLVLSPNHQQKHATATLMWFWTLPL